MPIFSIMVANIVAMVPNNTFVSQPDVQTDGEIETSSFSTSLQERERSLELAKYVLCPAMSSEGLVALPKCTIWLTVQVFHGVINCASELDRPRRAFLGFSPFRSG